MGVVVRSYINSSKIIAYAITNSFSTDEGWAEFLIASFKDTTTKTKFNFNQGQYYKFQICYFDDENNPDYTKGYYSYIVTGKCLGVSKPRLRFFDPEFNDAKYNNMPKTEYKVEYSTSMLSEGIYSYSYWLETNTGEISFQAFDIPFVFNADEKNDYTAHPGGTSSPLQRIQVIKFSFPFEITSNTTYKVYCKIKTVNGYEDQVYHTIKNTIEPVFVGELKQINDNSTLDSDMGCIRIQITLNENYSGNKKFHLKLLRISEDERYYTAIAYLNCDFDSSQGGCEYCDYNVESGKTYKYNLIETDSQKNIISKRIFKKGISMKVYYEDMFLSDCERCLKIRFNPKISSFKTTLLENKMDTIGNKYPFFFRNDTVGYKEFPINGLISYHMDDIKGFLIEKDDEPIKMGIENYSDRYNITRSNSDFLPTVNLVDYNVAAEKYFKIKVLDWLNNGNPKLFRSPTEGVYLVRLLNVSLAPEEALGRMLHSFSCTAYECLDSNPITNLIENNCFRFTENKFGNFISYFSGSIAGQSIMTLGTYESKNSLNTIVTNKEYNYGLTVNKNYVQRIQTLYILPVYQGWQWKKFNEINSSTIQNYWNDSVSEDIWAEMSEDGNRIFFEGACFNIKYDSQLPGLDTYFYLDGQKIYNITGHFETPEGQIYNKIEFPRTQGNYQSMITFSYYEEKTEEQIKEENTTEFEQIVGNAKQEIFSSINNSSANEIINLNSSQVVHKGYTITINKKDNPELAHLSNYQIIKVNGNIIDISDGQTRQYKEITQATIIEYGPGVQVDIHGYVYRKDDANV